ncbi:MAG: glutamate racemase [Anaerolineae bacterium]|nr:glutamate racemase [Anaerolineae bacterium]MDW8071866.1 glutamate racemase [Anaerolineae bacterium]
MSTAGRKNAKPNRIYERYKLSPVTIGLFDSGVGGLSIWQAVQRRLPNYATLYVADNAHCPYGSRPAREVRRFSAAITRFLLAQGAQLIVVACNTASAAALQWLRGHFSVPFVGLEPAVKPAAQQTRSGHIGILATQGTLQGALFRTTAGRYARDVVLHIQTDDRLAQCVEQGQMDTSETEQLLRGYLQPMLDAGVDQLVLGCTHYPFLLPVIQRILPPEVTVIDPAEAVARQVERCVRALREEESQSKESSPEHRFFVTAAPEMLRSLLVRATGREWPVERLTWRAGRLVPAFGHPDPSLRGGEERA